jgi:hypothetical protein
MSDKNKYKVFKVVMSSTFEKAKKSLKRVFKLTIKTL